MASSMAERLAALQALEIQGRLTPDAVVLAASDPDHPLHLDFEWDDDVAAAKYRVEQARSLIRAVRLVVSTQVHEMKAPVYVRDPDANPTKQGYVRIETADDEGSGHDVLEDEKRRIAGHIERSRSVAIRFGMMTQFDQWLEMFVAGGASQDAVGAADAAEIRPN